MTRALLRDDTGDDLAATGEAHRGTRSPLSCRRSRFQSARWLRTARECGGSGDAILSTLMSSAAPLRRATLDDFLAMPEDERFHELLDGEIVQKANPSFEHGDPAQRRRRRE
jgi:hypothetical protein